MKNLKRLSKFLALALRHRPLDFGLRLDDEGFTDVQAIWQVIHSEFGQHYTWEDLEAVVAGDSDGKKRYEIRDDQIRAMYGHNRTIAIAYPPAVPPEYLYHGTYQAAVGAIQQAGLLPRQRQYVHLTTNTARALKVAQRHSNEIVLLTIRALQAHNSDHVFYHAETEHYLTPLIPPEFIDFP